MDVIPPHDVPVILGNHADASLLLAREANVVVEDESFARELRDSLQAAITSGAKPVAREYAVKMNLTTRLMTWIAYGIVRTLSGISSYGRARDIL
jgi:cardiolipin synthase